MRLFEEPIYDKNNNKRLVSPFKTLPFVNKRTKAVRFKWKSFQSACINLCAIVSVLDDSCGLPMAERVGVRITELTTGVNFANFGSRLWIKRDSYFKGKSTRLKAWKLVIALGLGQILSLLICGTAVTSGILGENEVYIPTAQSFLNYVALCVVYTTLLACKGGENGLINVVKMRGWKYAILALIDVEANYLIVKAYHYTTVTSVQLLDCFTIPTVLLCSWCFLRVRYKWPHFLGVGVCLVGVGALILADVLVDRYSGEAQNKVLGDFLCLFGAMLYGLSNVGQEYVVRSFNRIEFLGMTGLFGSIINGIQFVLLERKELSGIDLTDYKIVISFLGFTACLFALYSLMPIVIEKTSATAVNLNLLSADFYALLVGLLLFRYKFHVLYFIAFVIIVAGLVIYSVRSPPVQSPDVDYASVTLHIDATQDSEPSIRTNSSQGASQNNDETTSLCSSPVEVNYVEARDAIADCSIQCDQNTRHS